MLANLLIVAPVFALILAGWIARKSGALGPNATREINRLVVYLALPALLFDIMANAKMENIWQPHFTLAFALGCAIVFGATLAWRMAKGHALPDAVIDGLNASYANTGFIGFPLILSLIGETGMAPTLIATIITVCVLFAIALVLIESGLQSGTQCSKIAAKTALSLAKNPLLISPVLGAVVLMSGWHMPESVHTFLKLLGGAASPCALITLGLFLAGMQPTEKREHFSTTSILVALKLVIQPAITWIIAGPIIGLSPLATHTAVLLAALPTGTGPFMLAEFYNREANLTGRVVLLSTVCSIATISACLALLTG